MLITVLMSNNWGKNEGKILWGQEKKYFSEFVLCFKIWAD